MTSRQDDNPSGVPLSEDQLLDWIEGRLDSQTQARLERASGRAGLVGRVQQMQANRRAMQALGQVKAPPELADRVLATLEREALVGLSNGATVEDGPPISMAEHRRTRQATGWRRTAPALAMAAGVTLLVGGGLYWGSLLLKKTSPIGPPNGPHTGTFAKATEGTATTQTPDAAVPLESAMKVADASAAEATALNEAPAAASLAMENGEISSAEALGLAREGRLVMRVRSSDARRLASLETPATSSPARAWRLLKDVPASVALAVMPAPRDFVGPMLAMDRTRAEAMMSHLVAPMVGLSAATAAIAIRPPDASSHVRGTYLLDVAAGESPLAKVTELLSKQLAADVVLERLPEPVALPEPTETERILWWTQSPAQWTPRVMIPVVVEDK